MNERNENYLEEKIAEQEVKDEVLQIADDQPLDKQSESSRVSRRRIVDQNNSKPIRSPTASGGDAENNLGNSFEPSPSTKQVKRSRRRQVSIGLNILIVLNLLLEIASAVVDQLASPRRPFFALISLLMSVLSAVLSTVDIIYKIRAHKARFQCKWPVPWFYYPSRGYNRIFGKFTDTVLLFCVFGHLITSAINYSFIQRGREGPIKISVWPLFFAFGMFFTMVRVQREKLDTKLTAEVDTKHTQEVDTKPAEEIETKPVEEIETKPAEEIETDRPDDDTDDEYKEE